jgi:uncharacterized membrane protein
MVHAFGVGAGVGFGLGFLNFIGTILFFVFMFWVFKMLFRGFRYGGPRGGPWSGRDWSGPPWSRSHHGSHGDNRSDDEAVTTARERFAGGEIDADEFTAIQQGLTVSRVADPADGYRPHPIDRALALARMRLARSEITPEEFETVRKTLSG